MRSVVRGGGCPSLGPPHLRKGTAGAPHHREDKNSGWELYRQVSAPGLGLGPWVATVASTPQVLLTGLLQLCLFAITDKRNNPAQQGTQAVVIGLLIVIIGVSLGMNSGYAINPSRDLPPRFFTFIAGWGIHVFRYCPALPIPARSRHVAGWGQCEEQHRSALQSSQAAEGGRGGCCSSPTSTDAHPAPDVSLSLNQGEADQGPRLRDGSWARMGVIPLLSGPPACLSLRWIHVLSRASPLP